MVLSAKFLIFLAGFGVAYGLSSYLWDYRKTIVGVAACLIAVFGMLVAAAHICGNYKCYDALANPYLTQSASLATLGGVAGIITFDFATKMSFAWEERRLETKFHPTHLIYLGAQALLISMVGLGVYAIGGIEPKINTPYVSIEFSHGIDPRIKPPPYDVKSERYELNDLLRLADNLPCVIEADRVLYQLTIDTNAADSITDSRPLLYQLLMLLRRAGDAQKAGEARHRIADIISPVKSTMTQLLEFKPGKDNEADLGEKLGTLQQQLTQASASLKRMASKDERDKYQLPRGRQKNAEWCEKLLSNHRDGQQECGQNATACNGSAPNQAPDWQISDIDEGWFSTNDVKNHLATIKTMPHIYLVTALMMWFDGDEHGAIRLLAQLGTSDETSGYIKNDPNVYGLLYTLSLNDNRPTHVLLEYSKKYLEKILERSKTLAKNKSDNPDLKLLEKRYDLAESGAKNNAAYHLIRQSEPPSFEDTDLSIRYASEAANKLENSGDQKYLDTLGYVRMVAALRGRWGDDADKKKHEIEAARRLLSNAYEIALNNYNEHAIQDDEPDYFYKLRIIEEHLKDAERYSAELNE